MNYLSKTLLLPYKGFTLGRWFTGFTAEKGGVMMFASHLDSIIEMIDETIKTK